MAVEAHVIEELIKAHIPDADIRIDDLRGDGDHYAAHVTSASFAGQSRIARHRMVQAAVEPILTKDLHALGIHTYVPQD